MRRTVVVTLILVLVALCLSASLARADRIYLKDGRSFEGKLVSDSGGVVKFRTIGGVLTFPSGQVDRIEKGKTKKDEFRERKEEIRPDDFDALLELARWCAEEKLVAERLRVLREILRACPGHPGARREQGEIYRNGKWVEGEPPKRKLEPGERTEIPDTLASVVLPEDWNRKTAKAGVTAEGPAPYAVPPVLEVAFVPKAGATADPFPEKEGWEKPAPVTSGDYSGHRSRRASKAEGVARAEILAVLSGPNDTLRVRLECLQEEAPIWEDSVALALRTLTFAEKPRDYVNEHYGYTCDFPDRSDFDWEEDDVHDLLARLDGQQIEDWARFSVVSGDPGQEYSEVEELSSGLTTHLKTEGDVTFDGEFEIGGVTGRLVDGTYLDDGTPFRRRVLTVKHGKRIYCIYCTQHEFGAKRTDAIWDVIVGSFRFTDME